MADKAKDITVYTTPLCAPCDALKKFLAANSVVFDVRDLLMDEDAQDRLDEAGIRSSPVLEIDGELIVGEPLNVDNLKNRLNL